MTSASDLGGVGPIVLAIDDDATTLGLITTQMAGLPFRVFTERSPLKAIGTAATLNPDVVLLDINMPELNGFGVLKELRRDEITRSVPVIMLTSVTQRSVVQDAMRQGVIDYIVKPWDRGRLVGKIESALHYAAMKRNEYRLEESDSIYISRDSDTVILSFRASPKTKEFLAEARSVFSAFFFKSIRGKRCIIDLRPLTEFDAADVNALGVIVRLFGDIRVSIVAGRHYGVIVAASDFEERADLFLSFGDAEMGPAAGGMAE
ncbi:MAG TPA: response regulator [Spirochaetota bacterium]|nr:response regulator [Spirochaetota bacterium]